MEQDQQNSFGKKIEPIQSKMLNESPEPYFKEEDHFAQNENAEDRKHRQKAQGYKIDSPELISELENKPAYLRKGLKLDNVEHSSEKNLSRWVISDGAAPEIKDSNSYLHDNVD